MTGPTAFAGRRVVTGRALTASTLAASVLVAGCLAGCGRPPRRPSEVLPGHTWRTVKAEGGPTYAFRAGQQLEMSRNGTTLSGTYQMPTDSSLVANVTGYIPGLGAGGPSSLTLRFDVRVLPAQEGHERVEFRAGTVADTLARVD